MKKKLTTFEREMQDPKFKEAFEKKDVEDKVIGLTVDQAHKFWDDIRVTKIDGVPCVVTRDYHIMRMNVDIVDSKIVKVNGWG